MGGIKTKCTGSLAFFSSAGHARLASLAEQPWFLSSTLFSGCSLLQNFVRFVVLVRFYSTVHTAYIRNEAHDISKGARPNETNSNNGQYCTWRNCQPWWFDWRIEEWSDKSCSARRDRTRASAEDHPLLKMTNVTLTPHFGSATACTGMKMMELVVMNLRAGLNGQKLPFGINW